MPFIELPTIHLGPLPIQFFGILVAIGVFVGTSVAARYTRHYNGSEDDLRYLGIRIIVVGFIMAHLVDVFFYTPGKVLDDPLLVVRLIEGISSYGGILGATIAFAYYAKKMNLNFLRYGDAVVYGFTVGFTFGRMGCATAHDHLGAPTDFPLAVTLPEINRCPELTLPNGAPDYKAMSETMGCANWRLPDGTAEVTAHDLGLYEVFICVALVLILSLIVKFWKTRKPGTLIAVAALYYAPIRFFLDFLRFPESDPTYLGLTPAQHMCIWTVVGGIVTIRAMRKPYNQSLYEPETVEKTPAESKPKSKPAQKGKAKVVRKKKKK